MGSDDVSAGCRGGQNHRGGHFLKPAAWPHRSESSPHTSGIKPESHGVASNCTTLVYDGAVATSKQVRRSVTLPARLAEQVERIARKKRLSDNRVLVELVEQGLEAQKEKEKAFFALAERFRASADPEEVKRLGDQMGRFVFGE